MYTIKKIPEDFVVEEIIEKEIVEGQFSYFWLKKNDYTTQKAIEIISRALHKPNKNFGFAGTKDRRAVTTQLISIKNISKEKVINLKFDNIQLSYYGNGKTPILFGDLKGNHFKITIRDIDSLPEEKIQFINYYGEQRFSTNNVEVGKSIIKKDFKNAVKLITQNRGGYERKVEEYIELRPTDYIGALKCVPKEILMMLVHSYQSYLWNIMAKHYSEISKQNIQLPLIGFDTEIKDQFIKDLLLKDVINTRDFIIRQIPSLTFEGTERNLYSEVKELKIRELEDDDLGKKKKTLIEFSLPKGCYATEFLKQIFMR